MDRLAQAFTCLAMVEMAALVGLYVWAVCYAAKDMWKRYRK